MIPSTISQLAAAPGVTAAGAFVSKFNDIILFPLIMLLSGIAMLYFIYGCVIYIANAENSEARATGRSHIIYSVVGMLVMLIAYSLLTVAANTFGLNDMLDCANNPLDSKCDNIMRVPGYNGTNSGGATQSGVGSGAGTQSGVNSGGAQQ